MENGVSFRSVLDLTYNLQRSCSYRRKIETERLDLLTPEFKRDRRLANGTMRWFCAHIDLLDESKCTERLFCYWACEVPMDDTDYLQLGLAGNKCNGLKICKCVVMDGNVIGALREFPVQESNVHELIGAKEMTAKLLSHRDTRKELRIFLQKLRSVIRSVEYGRAVEVSTDLSQKDGKVHFRLGSIADVK